MKRVKKQKKNILKITCIIMGVFILVSCDTPIFINKVVYNNSDYDLKFVSSNEEFVIPKKSQDTVFVYQKYARKVYDEFNGCGVGKFDSIYVVDSMELTLTKSLLENSNWTYEVRDKRIGQCSFIISNNDIN